MNILVERRARKATYTIGSLYIDGKYMCDTIEDKDRGLDSSMTDDEVKAIKIPGKTAIPTGTYAIDMNTTSPKFRDYPWAKRYKGKIPRLVNVPGFDGILIHPMNTAADSKGCIGPGENKAVGEVRNSTKHFYIIADMLLKAHKAGENIFITIK